MLTTKYAWKEQEADMQLKMLNEGFSETSIEPIKGVALELAIKALCGDGYVEMAKDRYIHSVADALSKKYNIPYSLVLEKAAKFGSLLVDETQQSGRTLSFCRMVKQTMDSQH